MSKTVLITRARGDENELTEALYESELNVIHEPLTDILLIHTARHDLEQALAKNPNAVLLTSRHGARALAALTPIRDLPLLCVGESTEHIAQSLGFSRTTVTGQNADNMIEYILSAYDEDAHFVYPSAEHVRNDLDVVLAQHGMETERIVVYEAKAVENLSDILIQHIKNGNLDAITFMSRRSAEIFMQLVETNDLTEHLANISACCMSKAIAQTFDEDEWNGVFYAGEPTLASLATCVDNALR